VPSDQRSAVCDPAAGRRSDSFSDETPLFSITAGSMDQYTDKLVDGTKAMLQNSV
jgi:hypothetical protein